MTPSIEAREKKRASAYLLNVLMAIYVAIGVSVLLRSHVALAILYIACVALSFLVVAYAMCAKCACRFHSCSHLWLGRLTRFLPRRELGLYTRGDGIGAAAYVGLQLLLPQYWLWQDRILLVLFWILALATFLVGPLHTCKACKNRYCPMNRNVEEGNV